MSAWGYSGEFTPVGNVLDPSVDYRARDLPVGVTVTVTFKGEGHTVFVVPPLPDNGRGWWRYVYRGERYRSLSAIARLITGDRFMSGNRFFKLRRRRR